MKSILLLLIFSNLCAGQNPLLNDHQWKLINLNINQTNYPPPSNYEMSNIRLTFDEQEENSIQSQSCNTAFGYVNYNGQSEYQVYDMNFTLSMCTYWESTTFEGIYFSFFQENHIYTYAITDNGDESALIITSESGDQAFYNSSLFSVNDVEPDNISIYPNPAGEFITVNMPNSISEIFEITIYNQFGQPLKMASLESQNTTIDISALSAGIYYLKVKGINNFITRKVIKH